jgi:S1-C subfamily serine protease
MQRGDLIVEVNRRNVDSVSDFKSAIDQHKKSGGVDLLIKRMNAGVMVIHLA